MKVFLIIFSILFLFGCFQQQGGTTAIFHVYVDGYRLDKEYSLGDLVWIPGPSRTHSIWNSLADENVGHWPVENSTWWAVQ